MSIISELFNPMAPAKRSGTTNPAQWLIDWVSGGAASASGIRVTEQKAMMHTPFWASVRIISGTVSSLPFLVYRRVKPDGKERAPDHPAYKLIHDRPNEYMDAQTFIETRQAHVLTYGNGYAEIQRDGGGRPVALWPLLPDRTFRKITPGGVPYYEVHPVYPKNPGTSQDIQGTSDPTYDGKTIVLPDYNVLHIKGLGFDGYTGYNVVHYHKETIGYGLGVKEYASRFFGNDASSGGALEHPETLSDDAARRLRESWDKDNAGLSKAHRTKILEEGMKWVKTGVDPKEAQSIDTQKFTVDDCSRIFNIPPHKLGSMDKSSFNNIEEQNIDFITSTMLYWFQKWEQEVNYKLFMPSERQKMFAEILVAGLLRGSTEARHKAYASGRQWGYYSINDIHRFENMNSIGPAGDIYLEPLNMKPAGTQDPAPPANDAGDDDARQAYHKLIEGIWARIIRKQVNAIKNGITHIFYVRHQDYAIRNLNDAVNAYAATKNITKAEASRAMVSVVTRKINKEVTLKETDAAGLADEIIKKIGDKNG